MRSDSWRLTTRHPDLMRLSLLIRPRLALSCETMAAFRLLLCLVIAVTIPAVIAHGSVESIRAISSAARPLLLVKRQLKQSVEKLATTTAGVLTSRPT